jgi:hypothetical protein
MDLPVVSAIIALTKARYKLGLLLFDGCKYHFWQ